MGKGGIRLTKALAAGVYNQRIAGGGRRETADLYKIEMTSVTRITRSPEDYGLPIKEFPPLIFNRDGTYRAAAPYVPKSVRDKQVAAPTGESALVKEITSAMGVVGEIIHEKDIQIEELDRASLDFAEEVLKLKKESKQQYIDFQAILKKALRGKVAEEDLDRIMRTVPGFEKK